jgi:hypothetical protein
VSLDNTVSHLAIRFDNSIRLPSGRFLDFTSVLSSTGFWKDLLAVLYFKSDLAVGGSNCENFWLPFLHAMSGVLQNPSGHSSSDVSVNVDVADKNGTHVVFNEQTNYVPKRTIITVSLYQIKVFRGHV